MAVDKVSTTITNPLTQNMVTATVMGHISLTESL